jgi:hypothetical protein
VRNFVRDIYRKMGATTGAGRPGSRPDPGLPDWALFADGGAAARAAAQSRTDRTRYREALALIRTETLDQPLDGRPGYSPIQHLGDLLDAGQVRWGILTDGARWRLYRRGSYATFEINLEAILQHPAVDRAEAFRWFYTFFRPGAFAAGDQPGYLDRLWAEAHGPEPVVQSSAASRQSSVDDAEDEAEAVSAQEAAPAEEAAVVVQEAAPAKEAAVVARRAAPAPAGDAEEVVPEVVAPPPAKSKTVRRKAPAAPALAKGKGAKGTAETKSTRGTKAPKAASAAPPAPKPAPAVSPAPKAAAPVEVPAPVAEAPTLEAEAPAPEPRRLSPEEEAQAFLDAAEAVLRRQGVRRPMHYRALMEQAVELDLLGPLATAASSTMSAKIMRDIDRREVEGQPPLFSRRGPGLFGLAEWDPQIYGRGSD